MKTRKLKKAIKRLKYLPGGSNLIKYTLNKGDHFIKKATKSTKVAFPSTLMIEVTNHCNLHCITCPREYGYGKQMDTGIMPLSKLKSIVDQAYPYIDSIGLTGLGEPFLYKHLSEAVTYIRNKSKGIITSISTNASLPNTLETTKQLINKIDTIQISIDGVGDTYNAIRKNGNFDTFIHNVEQMSKIASLTDTDLLFNAVIMKENYKQMKELVRLSSEYKIRFLNFTLFNLASVTDIDTCYYDFFYSPEFKKELKETIQLAKNMPELEFTIWDYTTPNSFRKCSFPWTHFYITWDGYLVPCCAKPFPKEMHFGNVFQQPLIDVLNSKKFRTFRNLWFQNKTPKFCKGCHFIDINPIDMEA